MSGQGGVRRVVRGGLYEGIVRRFGGVYEGVVWRGFKLAVLVQNLCPLSNETPCWRETWQKICCGSHASDLKDSCSIVLPALPQKSRPGMLGRNVEKLALEQHSITFTLFVVCTPSSKSVRPGMPGMNAKQLVLEMPGMNAKQLVLEEHPRSLLL